jgi:CarD family transcriptional regulator
MTLFQIGEKVVYPNHGIGTVENISTRSFGAQAERFYLLRLTYTSMTVMVPFSHVTEIGLRKVTRNGEVARVLGYLAEGSLKRKCDWKDRFKENSDRMRTGSLMEVAAVLKGLVALSRTKPLSFREKKMLERAKYLLVSELATVRNTSESAVEANLVRALAKAKLQMPETAPIPE